jgi:leucyl aminopeptidase
MKFVLLVCLLIVAVVAEPSPLRLIAFSETDQQWLTTSEVEKLIVNKVNFMDITDHQIILSDPIISVAPIPTEPQYKKLVKDVLIPTLNRTDLENNLNYLTTFNTRYYTSTTGVAAAQWILSKFGEIIKLSERTDITVALYTHTWAQPSVIATIPGLGPNKDEIVVIGGHEDSVGSTSTGRSPGADDDGSGTVTVIEIFRTLLANNNFQPDRTLQFITYAGEEAGLLGSQAIANSYKASGKIVHAVLQLDMTGYGGDFTPIAVIGDYVDPDVTAFVKLLIDTYSDLDWVDDKCGYACSDHASWYRAGYRSSFPFEAVSSNPYIHSANDIVSRLSFTRMLEFAKLGVAFAVELAQPTIEG